MLFNNLHPLFEQDGGPAGPVNFDTLPDLSQPGPAPSDSGGQPQEPAPQSEFAQYMGLDLSSIPAEQRPAMIERLKQVDSAFSPAMMKFKPWASLADQGITPDQVQLAFQLAQLAQSNPEEAARALGIELPAPPPPATQPTDDPLAPLAAYGDEVVGPVRKVWEVAQQAQQAAADLARQLKERDARDEKNTMDSAIGRAETGLTEWLGKNQHFSVQADQMRAELAKLLGRQGILAGLTAKDYETATLRVLGPEKYGDAVYAQRLQTARAKVDENRPGPVIFPGSPAAAAGKSGLTFDNDRAVLAEAMDRIAAMARQGGG